MCMFVHRHAPQAREAPDLYTRGVDEGMNKK
jgi:hypothetical protein